MSNHRGHEFANRSSDLHHLLKVAVDSVPRPVQEAISKFSVQCQEGTGDSTIVITFNTPDKEILLEVIVPSDTPLTESFSRGFCTDILRYYAELAVSQDILVSVMCGRCGKIENGSSPECVTILSLCSECQQAINES